MEFSSPHIIFCCSPDSLRSLIPPAVMESLLTKFANFCEGITTIVCTCGMRRGFLCFTPGIIIVLTDMQSLLCRTCTLMKLNPACGDNTRKQHNTHIHRTFKIPAKMIFTFTGSAELKLFIQVYSCNTLIFVCFSSTVMCNLCCKTASILCSITMSYMCNLGVVPLHVKKNPGVSGSCSLLEL